MSKYTKHRNKFLTTLSQESYSESVSRTYLAGKSQVCVELQRLSSSARLNLGHGVWQRLHSTNILLLPYISHLPLQLNLGHLMKSDPYRINGSNAPCVVSGLQQLRIGVLLWTELYPPKLIS
jgi:hypothetical protein